MSRDSRGPARHDGDFPTGGIATLPNAFSYRPVPAVTITGINPPAGPLAGGVVVTVTGTGFLPGATVTLGGRPATQVSVVDAQTITAITPRGRKGTVDLTITNPDKTTATLPNAYTYQVAPMIRRVTPRQEPQSVTEPSSTSPDPGSSEAVAVPALPETHPEGPTSITSGVPDVIGNAAGK